MGVFQFPYDHIRMMYRYSIDHHKRPCMIEIELQSYIDPNPHSIVWIQHASL